MRLAVPFPDGWAVSTRDAFVHAVAPEGDALTIDVAPLQIASGVVERTLGVEVPTTAELRHAHPVALRGKHGWPVVVVRASVVADGAVIEERLGAFFRFDDAIAPVLVRGRDPEVWNRTVGALDAIVLAADFVEGPGPACLADVLGLAGAAP